MRPMGIAAYGRKGQGKGKGRGEGRLGQGGRGRSKGGEKPMGTTAYGGKGSKGRVANGDRPIGAASCRRDHHTMASCQTPPPTLLVVVSTSPPGVFVMTAYRALIRPSGEDAMGRSCILDSHPGAGGCPWQCGCLLVMAEGSRARGQ